MSCNQSGFCAFGNSWWWIIILLLIFGTGSNGCGNSCGCDTGCGCSQRYMTQKGSGVSRSPCVRVRVYLPAGRA